MAESAESTETTRKERDKQRSAVYHLRHRAERLEKQREYYRRNKERLKAKNKEYYEANRHRMLDFLSEYYHEHRDEISATNKERVICECGIEVSRGALSRHRKTDRHLSKMAIDEQETDCDN